MMNEKNLRIAVIILSFILIITSAVCAGIIRHYKLELERTRAVLESARDRNSDIERTVDRFVERTSRIYSRAGTSITEIREAVSALQDEFDSLTEQLHHVTSDERMLDCEY